MLGELQAQAALSHPHLAAGELELVGGGFLGQAVHEAQLGQGAPLRGQGLQEAAHQGADLGAQGLFLGAAAPLAACSSSGASSRGTASRATRPEARIRSMAVERATVSRKPR